MEAKTDPLVIFHLSWEVTHIRFCIDCRYYDLTNAYTFLVLSWFFVKVEVEENGYGGSSIKSRKRPLLVQKQCGMWYLKGDEALSPIASQKSMAAR